MKDKILFISIGLIASVVLTHGRSDAVLMPMSPEIEYDEMVLAYMPEKCGARSYGFRFTAKKKDHLETTGKVCDGIILNIPDKYLYETKDGKPIPKPKKKKKK